MKIIEVTATSFLPYGSGLSVTFRASIGEDEDPVTCGRLVLLKAEETAQAHQKSIEEFNRQQSERSHARESIGNLTRAIPEMQTQLEQLLAAHPDLAPSLASAKITGTDATPA